MWSERGVRLMSFAIETALHLSHRLQRSVAMGKFVCSLLHHIASFLQARKGWGESWRCMKA